MFLNASDLDHRVDIGVAVCINERRMEIASALIIVSPPADRA